MKRLVITVLAAAVVAAGLSSIMSYSTSSYIDNQRGWPVGYYHWVSNRSTDPLQNLCSGGVFVDANSEQCLESIPVLSYPRIALNFAVWLGISSVAGYSFYFFRQKSKHPRA